MSCVVRCFNCFLLTCSCTILHLFIATALQIRHMSLAELGATEEMLKVRLVKTRFVFICIGIIYVYIPSFHRAIA